MRRIENHQRIPRTADWITASKAGTQTAAASEFSGNRNASPEFREARAAAPWTPAYRRGDDRGAAAGIVSQILRRRPVVSPMRDSRQAQKAARERE